MITRKIIFAISLTALLFSCGPDQKTERTDEAMTKPVENINATQDQKDRRAKSEAYCKAHDIPFYTNPNSLFVDAEADVQLRTKDEVVDRALALCYLGLKSEGLEQEYLDEMNVNYTLPSKFSPQEKLYVNAKNPSEQQTIDANWRYESLHVMLWALGYLDSLNYPDHMCDVANDVAIIHNLSEQQFRDKAKLRSKSEILDQADLILRLDWACVNARVNGEPAPGGIDGSVVLERHYSLNWLIRYMEQEWDDVTTDT